MISLTSLAAEYACPTADRFGYDFSPRQLRAALLVAIEARRYDIETIVIRLADKPGSPCPPFYRGELRAAQYALSVAERDLRELTEKAA